MKDILVQLVVSFFATGAFAVLVQVRGWPVVASAAGGALAWITYFALASHASEIAACFVGAVVAAAYSEVMARVFKRAVILFVASAIIPLVPGAMLYETMFAAISEKTSIAVERGIETLIIAGALCAGIATVASVMLIFKGIVRPRLRSLGSARRWRASSE